MWKLDTQNYFPRFWVRVSIDLISFFFPIKIFVAFLFFLFNYLPAFCCWFCRNRSRRGSNSMQSGSKSKCASASHQFLLDNAKNRLNDLQEKFANLRVARKEGRANDVAVLEEQVNQILREWNSELSAPSPASSLLVCI